MKISVPKEPTYYYEITGKGKRLLYWIPGDTLKSMVAQGRADKAILDDFPDGVDVKVTKEDFADFGTKYGLKLDIDPDAAWNAFLSLSFKDEAKYRGVGYIPQAVLDSIADDVQGELEKHGLAEQVVIPDTADSQQRRRLFIDQVKQDQEKTSLLKKYRPKKIKDKKPIFEQLTGEIEMTTGDEPFKVFSAIQMRRPKEVDDASDR